MTLVRSGMVGVVLLLLSLPAGAAELVVKRVMLSAGGVGYVEREAEVEGDAELGLDVPLDQVDDVLKSVVVYDSAGGVGSAHLPGREPVAQIFADLPFGAEALASPDALLNALQGAEIRIGGSHAITGKLMKVVPETVRLPDQSTLLRHRVSVMTQSGLQQVILEEADSIAFTDGRLQAQVERALAAIAEHHAKDRRRIVLTAHGQGKRVVRVGYVVAAPLWKSTYRLILGEAAGKAHLQGWAVLENMSGEDWNKIELTLFSGRPVSFRQALYQAYYVNRPEVPVEVAGKILSRIDTGAIASTSGIEGRLKDDRDLDKKGLAENALRQPASMPAPASPAPEERPVAGAADVAAAEEGMTQVAFRIPVPVSIKSGESAIVAIVDRDFPVKRLALYQPATVADHPLAAIELKNESGNGLPAGVLTVYEQRPSGTVYLGDARLGALPVGESRLLSYAVDEKTTIAREVEETTALAKVAAARGVLRLNHVSRQTIHYRIAAPKGEGRHLVIQEAKVPDWTLIDPQELATEQTAGAYRLALELQPGESRKLALVLQRSDWEETAIGEIGADALAAMVADGELDARAKQALEQLARLRQAVADAEAEQKRLTGERQSISQDQGRIRENLRVLNPATELAKRYVAKLDAQETTLDTLRDQAATAATAQRSAKAALDDFIGQLEL